MKLFNLRSDPKEETDIKDFNPWVVERDRQDRRPISGRRWRSTR